MTCLVYQPSPDGLDISGTELKRLRVQKIDINLPPGDFIDLWKFSQLIAKINIEKYCPYSSKENQSEILKEIEEVYSKL